MPGKGVICMDFSGTGNNLAGNNKSGQETNTELPDQSASRIVPFLLKFLDDRARSCASDDGQKFPDVFPIHANSIVTKGDRLGCEVIFDINMTSEIVFLQKPSLDGVVGILDQLAYKDVWLGIQVFCQQVDETVEVGLHLKVFYLVHHGAS